jgi:chloramphenicol 3-O phosphotransferase
VNALPRLIVIEGGSGTGKTSLARALQERLLPHQWLAFCPDTILGCLPRSIVERAAPLDDPSGIDGRAIFGAAYACVNALLSAGNRVIFDCVVTNEQGARKLLSAFAAHDPIHIHLTCRWDEISRRTLARGDRTLEEAEHGLKTSGLHLVADHDIDTTGRAPDELAEALADSLAAPGSAGAWRRNMARLGLQLASHGTGK